MDTFLYVLVTLVLLGLAVALARLAGRRAALGTVCALIVTVGLVYDNAVIAAGAPLGSGPLLEGLSWPRYLIHALGTPLLVLFGWDAAVRAGLEWARRPAWRSAFWLLTLALIAYGVIVDLLPLSLEPTREGGILTYTPVGGSSFPLPAVVTMAALLAVGAALWWARGWAGLAVGSLLAAAGFGLAPALGSDVVGQVAEVVLIGAILLTERWLRRELSAAALAGR